MAASAGLRPGLRHARDGRRLNRRALRFEPGIRRRERRVSGLHGRAERRAHRARVRDDRAVAQPHILRELDGAEEGRRRGVLGPSCEGRGERL